MQMIVLMGMRHLKTGTDQPTWKCTYLKQFWLENAVFCNMLAIILMEFLTPCACSLARASTVVGCSAQWILFNGIKLFGFYIAVIFKMDASKMLHFRLLLLLLLRYIKLIHWRLLVENQLDDVFQFICQSKSFFCGCTSPVYSGKQNTQRTKKNAIQLMENSSTSRQTNELYMLTVNSNGRRFF